MVTDKASQHLLTLPQDLPVPLDDSACDHLGGQPLPACRLHSTQGKSIDLSTIKGWLVLYCYPMTGRPDTPLPDDWNAIPGARGCTPQSCAFRDYYQELQQLGAQVFGLSVQTRADQREAAARLHLPFALLSDVHFQFTDSLNLPTFRVGDLHLNRRVTLIAQDGVIQHYFYPVFPPDRNADDVIAWLKQHV